ncbi:MAG TPA: glycosyltransferase family 4 protein [Pyrinomonadaceae bacterium]|nr:glycosyltransferase family 4 protein [Pyrinomonadaceae bacterium]
MKRILFIGHEASRSGAPMILLHFLEWLKENDSSFEADLLLLQPGGDLEDEYRKVINTYVLPRKAEKPSLFRRGANFLRKKLLRAPGLPDLPVFTRRYDVVLGNTVISLEYLKLFRQKGFRTISWLHELDFAVNLFSREKFIELSADVDRFLVVSKAVEEMLKRFGIRKKTHQVYGFSKAGEPLATAAGIEAVKKELGIPPDAFIVGASGTIEWRKGADIFLQAARASAARCDDIYFLWVGGKSPYSSAEYDRVRYDFERLGLKEKVIFTGLQKNPHKFYAAMDLFVLTSREDPFPLVCLEAASHGKPTICFDKAGGMTEFVGADAGAIVPYGDIEALCEKIIYFYENPDALRRTGEAARAKVNSEFSPEKSCARIKEVLLEALAEAADNR